MTHLSRCRRREVGMAVLLFCLLVSLFGGWCLHLAGGTWFGAEGADVEMPDTVPSAWVEAYRADRGHLG